MIYKPCYFYSSEYKKVYKLLNDLKQDEYIIKSIDFNNCKAEFIKTNQNFVYGVDYSLLYNHNKYFFNEEHERFDMVKLAGWKLQCCDDGIGIWIHDDVNQVTPFFLDEEYKKIEQENFKYNLISFKKWLKYFLCLFCMDILLFLNDRSLSFYYQVVFLLYIIIACAWKIMRGKLITNKVFDILFINYMIAFCFSYFPLNLSLLLEIITVIISIDVIREKSFILKTINFHNIYHVIILIIAIYASLVYKI